MNIKSGLFLGLAFPLIVAGCSSHRVDVPWPKPQPLGQDLTAFQPPVDPDAPDAAPPEPQKAEGVLTLRKALALALLHSPELATASWTVRVKEAETLQAGLFPNPELELEIEEFAGSGERKGFDSAESTLQLSQLIELGGKRSKRQRLAGLERDLAAWDYEAKRLDVLTETAKAFIEVLGAQERLALAQEQVRLSEKVLNTISERVAAGKVSPIEETKAKVTVSTSRIARDSARRDVGIARKRLASNWASATPAFERVEGLWDDVSPVPSIEQLAGAISRNPDVARWTVELAKRQAAADLEEARAIPDLTLGAGPQWFRETDDAAVVFGLSIPIPLANRNQGARMAARYDLKKVREEERAAQLRVRAAMAETHETLAAAHAELEALNRDVLLEAQKALDAVSEGYREGKLDYLDVLDSQRTLFEAKALQIEASATYHKAVADLERLIGAPLVAIGNGGGGAQEDTK